MRRHSFTFNQQMFEFHLSLILSKIFVLSKERENAVHQSFIHKSTKLVSIVEAL